MIFENVVEFEKSTRTAQEAATALECEVNQIAKSIIFRSDDEAILVIACGGNRVDERRVEKLLGKEIGKADADFCKKATRYVIGGIPPFGHTTQLMTFIDEDLKQYPYVWAAAGKPNAVFKIRFKELVRKTKGLVANIKQTI